MSTLALNKLTASFRGDPNNSTGEDVAKAVNAIIDHLAQQSEVANITVVLESAAETLIDARKAWQLDPDAIIAMAERNQLKLEQAIGTRDASGNLVPIKGLFTRMNIVLGYGYFPILGDLLLPPGSGVFQGQGSFVRRKSRDGIYDNIEEYATALCPVGSTNELEPNNKNGILQQTGTARIGNFAILGIFKNEWDGGNGMITGHTPPENADPTLPTTSAAYWAGQPNRFTQDRFKKPKVFSDLTSFTLDNGSGDSEIIVPERGTYDVNTDVIPDESIDVPLVRWVRAFDAQGNEIFTKLNVPSRIKNFSLSDVTQNPISCSGKPPRDENGVVDPTFTKIYHKPLDETDTTTVVVPGGLPADTASVEVSLYNLQKFKSMISQMTPFLSGPFNVNARSSYTQFKNIVSDSMPWNGFVLVDGAYNTFELCMSRQNGLDGWYAPGGYEDLMHVNFTSCAAVNNGGWAVYFGEAFQTIMGGGSHKWPDPVTGELVYHYKYTYTASCNNLGNFDCYGNQGGAYYIGGASNASTGINCEHHFDVNHADPWGNSASKSDVNPLRWNAINVLTPRSFQNDLKFNTTSTDSRRILFCKQRKTLEPVGAKYGNDGNYYSAMSKNYVTLPAFDDSGWLTTVRSPGFHHLHLTPWREHDRTSGDMQTPKVTHFHDIRGLFSGTNEYLFHPWAEEKLNYLTKGNKSFVMRFSANHGMVRKDAVKMGIAADWIGWNNQTQEHAVKYGVASVDFGSIVKELLAGKIIPDPVDPTAIPVWQPPVPKTITVTLGEVAPDHWVEWDSMGSDRIIGVVNYLNQGLPDFDNRGNPDTDIDPAGNLPETVAITQTRFELYLSGDKKMLRAKLTLLNMGDSDLTWDPNVTARHYFRYMARLASSDASFKETPAGQRWDHDIPNKSDFYASSYVDQTSVS